MNIDSFLVMMSSSLMYWLGGVADFSAGGGVSVLAESAFWRRAMVVSGQYNHSFSSPPAPPKMYKKCIFLRKYAVILRRIPFLFYPLFFIFVI